MKSEKFIKNWIRYRQEGKEKYVGKRSILIAVSILVGQSAAKLYRGELGFFNFSNLILIFVVSYIAARIGATNGWNRYEKKYSKLINDIEE
ncbi:hypothetical protein Amet_1806 [Alkaliphilus metalliredigens QYMF]|uniref:Uncharacterized protein n=1 Tax=Alkaliphilus metalliredigens (strain QYMF) TaxID=293826 RepID=A6TP58_ALKMQ|nr:hypothetical protein [Alkaliphilus metalliredigens]ABR47976.1 hypothetical protein Amet_1806 [Alkaliphilus metalliredigens QYMF]